MFSQATIIAAAAFFANAVNSHMIMAKPVPYGKPDNSPLSPGGSDYPCKLPQTNGFQGTAQSMPSGSQQTLSFSGTAVHGGGSCQISLTKDAKPSAGSAFKVIHSFHGGCPGVDGAPTTFNFQMPSEVPNGDYVLAWTWFNTIGNREMYMNCAPVSVTGSSGSDSQFSGLPDMAIYNIASKNSCKTKETTDVRFPNPGKYVTTSAKFANSAADPVGSDCGASGANSGASSNSGSTGANSGSGTPASGPSGGNSGSGSQSANNGQYTGIGSSGSRGSGGSGTFGEGAGGAPAASPSATLATVYTSAAPAAATSAASSPSSAPVAPAAAPATPDTGASSPSTGTAIAGGSCSQDGAVVCSADGSQFGLCNWGKVVMMPVAAGTKCSGGQIRRRNIFHW